MHRSSDGVFRHKTETPVRLQLAGEKPENAFVFLNYGERVIDLLNDMRHFIPVKRENGDVFIVAKTQIVQMEEVKIAEEFKDPQPEPLKEPDFESSAFDPYTALRISRSASLEEIREAYKKRIKAVHPDTVTALGLDQDLAKAALYASQKVNFAYRKILRDREAASARGNKASAVA